ncbi:spermidine/putrescine ABC transporter substrate-binding protein [Oscillatoria sp. FACHB-1407]|uniref:ABC transporter substrate-binding protein n=1 Tax=Oscillatoria sp. FACHB-1407 TaxID=2692847 RepID=UPI001684F73F|nr:spermidine/putrescine ABC transporter substrate-binding protein [Oscillatoria sp. FACHB-1407]MBD2462900.1 spermidine/putrescine ABC transporter substrate-binding protein [Oscillatoria sp. FACHB-1407]
MNALRSGSSSQPWHFSSKTRRRFLQVSGAALAGIALSSCRRGITDVQAGTNGGGTPSDTLYVYSWAGYSDDELLSNFAEATGIKVIVDIFDSNETMLAKLQAGGGNNYSIIYPSDYMVQQMVELDMLVELDQSRLQGLDVLLDKFKNPVYDPNNAHSVPASWGTTGLVYNTEQVNPPPTDWNYLWDNRDQLSRRITLFNDVREVMGATLRSLGYSYNSTNPQEIEAAYNKLLELKPAITNFTTDGWRDQLLTGDLVVAMGYSVDAITTMEEDPRLNYVIPASGSSIWTDTMAIPKTAPNPDAAYAWINFMLEPSNAARTVERLKFATASKAAIDLLPAELKADKNLFPDEAILSKCEGIAPVGDATDLYDRYWTQLTSI